MHLRDICRRDVVTVRPTDGVSLAAQIMRDQHVGYLVVVMPAVKDGGATPVGVLSDRDIVIAVVAQKVDPRSILVGDVMTPQPVVIPETTPLNDAMQSMRDAGIRRIPLVDSWGRLSGILVLDDVVAVLAGQLQSMAQLVQTELRGESSLRM